MLLKLYLIVQGRAQLEQSSHIAKVGVMLTLEGYMLTLQAMMCIEGNN